MEELLGILFILCLMMLFILLNTRILKDQEVIIVERLGKFHRIITEKGIHFFIPFVDRPIEKLSLQIKEVTVKDQNDRTYTVLFYINDPYIFIYDHEDADISFNKMLEDSFKEGILEVDLDHLKQKASAFGINIVSYK